MDDIQRKRFDASEPDRTTVISSDLKWLAISDTDDDESDYREIGSFDRDRHELSEK